MGLLVSRKRKTRRIYCTRCSCVDTRILQTASRRLLSMSSKKLSICMRFESLARQDTKNASAISGVAGSCRTRTTHLSLSTIMTRTIRISWFIWIQIGCEPLETKTLPSCYFPLSILPSSPLPSTQSTPVASSTLPKEPSISLHSDTFAMSCSRSTRLDIRSWAFGTLSTPSCTRF